MIPNTTAQPRRTVLPVAALLTLLLLAGFAVPATADASSTMVAACDYVSLRSGAKTSATRKALIPAGTRVRAVSTVDGGSYSASCGTAVSGSKWFKIDAVNGKAVSSLYGVSYVYAATKLFKAATAAATPPPAGTDSKGAALMRLVSADRKALGKSRLAIDPSLVAIARNAPFTCPTKSSLSITGRARDMAVRSYFSHDIKGCRKSDGTSYRAREILAVVYGYTGSRSEIIHWNSAGTADTTYKVGCDGNGSNCKGGTITVSKTVATAQRNFMSSSTHRAVELSTRYDRFGCGSAKAPDSARVYYACLFTVGGPTVLAKPTPTPAPTPTPKLTNASCTREPANEGDDERHAKGDDLCRDDGPGHRHRHLRRQLQHRVRRQGRRRQELVQDRPDQRQVRVVALRRERGVRGRGPVPSGLLDDRVAAAREHRDDRADGGRRWRGGRPDADANAGSFANADTRSLPHPDAVSKSDAQPDPDPVPEPDAAHRQGLHTHVQRDVLRPRPRSRRRPLAVRRTWPRGCRPGLRRDPRPLLPGRDAGHHGQLADPGPGPQRLRSELDATTDDLWANRHVHDRRDIRDVPEGRPCADLPDHEQRHDLEGVVTSAGGTTLHSGSVAKSFRIRPAQTSTRLQVYSRTSTYDRYRGVLRIVASTKVDVINELPLESYLRGVVPAEMPSHWHAEALKAQTVAARSFAARRLRPGVSTFDVYDDTRSQVYHGVLREMTSTNSAITATAGKVLKSGSSIASTFFHSTGGGATEHNENVFVSSSGAKVAGPVSYLRGSSDRAPDGKLYDASSPYISWKTATYTRSQLSSWLAGDSRTNVGSVVKLDLRNRGVSGRLISVTIIGSTGTKKTVSGDVFRSVINARRPAGDPLFRANYFALTPVP